MIECSLCGGPIRSINKHGVCTRTAECRRVNACKRNSYAKNRLGHILRAARRRAVASGSAFELTLENMPPVPEECPILGIPLKVNVRTGSRASSPSLDRRDPTLGYVPSNVWWISHLANTMKSSADQATLQRFAEWVLGREFAQMGLPVCKPCPYCTAEHGVPAGHVPADDEDCSACGKSLRVWYEQQDAG